MYPNLDMLIEYLLIQFNSRFTDHVYVYPV